MRASLRALQHDERGAAFLIIVGVIVTPILLGLIVASVLGMARIGGGLVDMFNRSSIVSTMTHQFTANVANAADIRVIDDTEFVAVDDPNARPAFYLPPGGGAPSMCVEDVWKIVRDGDQGTITHTMVRHETADCDSPITSEKTILRLTGVKADTTFTYGNPYGRDLHFTGGVEQGEPVSTDPRPSGLFDEQWAYPKPGFVTLTGTAMQMLGESHLDWTAQSSLRSYRG